MLLKNEDIKNLTKTYRLHLINSLSGVKPANLIATCSKDGEENVAIFSSLVHLGSNPAQFGFITRVQAERDTYANIMETGYYTINHVSSAFMKKAHYTSAVLERGDSEFDAMNIEKTFIAGFDIPFVKDSQVKIGMKHTHNVEMPNGCTFVVGEVVLVELADNTINERGQLNLEAYDCVGISGLNSYYGLEKLATYPHVGRNELPDFYEETTPSKQDMPRLQKTIQLEKKVG